MMKIYCAVRYNSWMNQLRPLKLWSTSPIKANRYGEHKHEHGMNIGPQNGLQVHVRVQHRLCGPIFLHDIENSMRTQVMSPILRME